MLTSTECLAVDVPLLWVHNERLLHLGVSHALEGLADGPEDEPVVNPFDRKRDKREIKIDK